MARVRDEDIDTSDAPDDDRLAPIPAAAKSRGLGCFFVLLGAAFLVAAFLFGIPSLKVMAVLAGFGTAGLLIGGGMVAVPWTQEMFDVNEGEDIGRMFRAMPAFRKVWFVLSMAAMLG